MSKSTSLPSVSTHVRTNSNSDIDNNNCKTNQQFSHRKDRCFKPSKLSPPRNFTVALFTQDMINKRQKDNQKMILEIGAGKGRHAYQYALRNPTHRIIAIERTLNKFNAFSDSLMSLRQSGENLDNLLAVHADAIPYVVFGIMPSSLDVIYLLYPNPEPKNPNQQWLNMPFFEFLLSRLKPKGKVVLASNIESYIQNAYAESMDTWALSTEKSCVPQDSARTHFEVKYLKRGETCWQLDMTKPDGYKTRFDNWIADNLKN